MHVTSNNSFYLDDHSKKGRKDVVIEIIFSKHIHKALFESIQNAKTHPGFKANTNTPNDKEEKKEGIITLSDCLEEFKKSEILDEDNKWYCGKCKEHV